MNKLRLHLAAGKNHKHWQLTLDGKVTYHDPDKTQFRLTGCELKNNRKKAEAIYAGAHKSVCAWVQFQTIEVVHDVPVGLQVRFNPRIRPHWALNWHTKSLDNMILMELLTDGRSICLPYEPLPQDQ